MLFFRAVSLSYNNFLVSADNKYSKDKLDFCKQTASGKYRDLKKTRRRFDLKDKIYTGDFCVLTCGFGRFFHVSGKAFQDTMGQDSAKAFNTGRA